MKPRSQGDTLGTLPWDGWFEQARASGVAEHLALLGREVMRDVVQHGLDESITLGARDDGPLLIDMMLLAPISTETLLAVDRFSRQGFGDEAYDMVDEAIAKRLRIDVDEVEEMRSNEHAGLAAARRADALRRPQNYASPFTR